LRAAYALGDRLGFGPAWCAAGALAGALPLVLGYLVGRPEPGMATAWLLTPLLAAAVARDWFGRGFGLITTAFLAHNAVAIALVAADPAGMAPVLVDGAGYWEKSRAWIETGVCPEYDVSWWLPAHAQLLVLMVLHTYLSLGLVTFWQGLHEVDLMNYYVGALAAHSKNPWLAIVLGWHPWSVCRGIGYLFLTYEVASFSLARLTATSLSPPRRRAARWALGLGFLVLDGLIKYHCLEPVRRQLAGNLLG
jgi:hypothetical protein